ncbi:hypothetical protein [Saccharothrix australiensis]|uniref:Secreted protein n=1 Tax=Saccharothrix australiensis TaxID=2072 RepID=A0A495W0J0_9PSEU|nr:hypothetical protein [Saccharothrix australiensis]RKT54979.1 hypothetical protein C8E97_3632 [Saccharothrix australiensis]
MGVRRMVLVAVAAGAVMSVAPAAHAAGGRAPEPGLPVTTGHGAERQSIDLADIITGVVGSLLGGGGGSQSDADEQDEST